MSTQAIIRAFCALAVMGVLWMTGYAADERHPMLSLYIHNPYGFTSSCQQGSNNVLAGSVMCVSVKNTLERSTDSVKAGWPEGYRLEVALDVQDPNSFTPMPDVLTIVTPIPYLSLDNRINMKLKTYSDTLVHATDLNKKAFTMRFPSELIGHTVTVRARYVKGDVSLLSNSDNLTVIAPCDQADSIRVLTSLIFAAWHADSTTRAMELADSMLAREWTNYTALDLARSSADHAQDLERMLYFIDRIYMDYGVGSVHSLKSQLPLHQSGPVNSEEQQMYEQARQSLLKEIADKNAQKPQPH